MRYVVGYQATERGREAIALAATLARTRDAELEVVLVAPPRAQSFDPYSPNRTYRRSLDAHAREWLAEAAAQVPEGVTARTHLRYAESSTQGLIEAAEELGAGLVVVGAARGGPLKHVTVGSVANALLHAAPVPVALAPSGYRMLDGITRVTCATGERAGAEALLEVAIESAQQRGVELRLVSLVALDDGERRPRESARPAPGDPGTVLAEEHVDALAARAREELPASVPVTTAVGHGDSVEDAVAQLDFADTELVLVGSSRLAARHRIFLGPAAQKILRAVPVPIVVVPRDHGTP